MIGRLAGRLIYTGDDHAVIDVGGVGYVVQLAGPTLATLPPPGSPVTLWTEMLVREDMMALIGFTTLVEKEWFRLLTSVQGVGVKSALAVIGVLGADGVSRAIALGDWAAIRAAPGIGPKIAQRVVNELRDRAPAVMAMGAVAVGAGAATGAEEAPPAATASGGGSTLAAEAEERGPARAEAQAAGPAAEQAAAERAAGRTGESAERAAERARARAEALSALANLGYAPGEAARALAEALGRVPEGSTAELIRASLRLLAPKA